MTSHSKRTSGSIVLVAIIIVLLVGALGFVGWRMLTRQNADDQAKNATTHTSAEVILTEADLEAAEKSLDELDFSDKDAQSAELQANL